MKYVLLLLLVITGCEPYGKNHIWVCNTPVGLIEMGSVDPRLTEYGHYLYIKGEHSKLSVPKELCIVVEEN